MYVYKDNLKKKKGVCLLLIDPQVDFHPPNGSLAVPNADQDACSIASFVRKHLESIDNVLVTLDSHQNFHIAHPLFWVNDKGLNPEPFTKISAKDFQARKWFPVYESMNEWCEMYLRLLEMGKRFDLTIWPPHCLIGQPGHSVVEPIVAALNEWETKKLSAVEYVIKGMNSLTEHYSAIRAEVARPDDNRTKLNTELLEDLNSYNKVIIAGQALSHCVNFTCRDLMDHWKGDPKNVILLKDCCSPVAGFELEAEQFIADMKLRGVTIQSWIETVI